MSVGWWFGGVFFGVIVGNVNFCYVVVVLCSVIDCVGGNVLFDDLWFVGLGMFFCWCVVF